MENNAIISSFSRIACFRCGVGRGDNFSANDQAASRAFSMLKLMIAVSTLPRAILSNFRRGHISASSPYTSPTRPASTPLILSKSPLRLGSSPGGTVSAATIPKSRLICAFMPISKCCNTIGHQCSVSLNARTQDCAGIWPV